MIYFETNEQSLRRLPAKLTCSLAALRARDFRTQGDVAGTIREIVYSKTTLS